MTPEELRETFDHYDADDNGRIDESEFMRLMQTLHADEQKPIDRAELQAGFDELDQDGNGTIEYGEFASWWEDRWEYR